MEERNDGKIIDRDVENEMKSAYMSYAMSVIVSRALPDVRDGLNRSIDVFYIQCMKMV